MNELNREQETLFKIDQCKNHCAHTEINTVCLEQIAISLSRLTDIFQKSYCKGCPVSKRVK